MITKFNKTHQIDASEGYTFVESINNKEVTVSYFQSGYIDCSVPLPKDENKWVEMYCIIHDASWKDLTITREMISDYPVDENSAKILQVNLVEYKGVEAGLVGRGYVLDKNEVVAVSDIGKYINLPLMDIVMRSYKVLSISEIVSYGLSSSKE